MGAWRPTGSHAWPISPRRARVHPTWGWPQGVPHSSKSVVAVDVASIGVGVSNGFKIIVSLGEQCARLLRLVVVEGVAHVVVDALLSASVEAADLPRAPRSSINIPEWPWDRYKTR